MLGQPVAWCISDREDTGVVEAFLQAVKNRAGDCNVQVVMTDDAHDYSKSDAYLFYSALLILIFKYFPLMGFLRTFSMLYRRHFSV